MTILGVALLLFGKLVRTVRVVQTEDGIQVIMQQIEQKHIDLLFGLGKQVVLMVALFILDYTLRAIRLETIMEMLRAIHILLI